MLTDIAVAPGLSVELGVSPPEPSSEVQARIVAIWAAETARLGDKLFNGRVLSVERLGPERIVGWWTDYRRLIAQRREPRLYPALQVRSLAVTGILACRDGVVLGRRGPGVATDAGRWELAPAGSVDGKWLDAAGRPDLRAQVLVELEEEIGIAASCLIEPPAPVGLVEDEDHAIDVGLVLRVGLGAAEVEARFAGLAGREHSELRVVPVAEVGAFLATRGDEALESARLLLARALARL